MTTFVNTGSAAVPIDRIEWVDLKDLESGQVHLHTQDRTHTLEGTFAIEALMLLKPSALEGHRLKWMKFAWVVHNMIGHPLMQLLALLRLYKAAIWVHDATVPHPIGFKQKPTNPA